MHYALAIPHIFVMIMACLGLLVAAFNRRGNSVYYLVQFTLLVAMYLSYRAYTGQTEFAFFHSFISDGVSAVLNVFICFFTFVVFVYSRQYIDDRKIPNAEYYLMGLLATLGMMIITSGFSLLTLYMGLELLALPTYAMVAMDRTNDKAIEAAMKYFVVGAVASGLLLFGMSLVFGATQSLNLHQIALVVASTPWQQNLILVFGLVFLLAGLAFKLGAAPFHMWVPDVYEGAPTATALFIAATPKIAAFALAVRLLPEAFPTLHVAWSHILIVMAIASMAIGNLAALVQTNMKRLFAYSSIAHMGYFLLGIVTDTAAGFASSMFYMITYTLMTLAAFGMLLLFSRAGFEMQTLEDFKGLNHKHPWLAFVMLIVMFSMAGIPPLVGFMAKLGVLEALIAVHLTWLAVLAIVFAIIGAFYYIRVVKVMYFEDASDANIMPATSEGSVALTLNALFVLALGLFPGGLFTLCHHLF